MYKCNRYNRYNRYKKYKKYNNYNNYNNYFGGALMFACLLYNFLSIFYYGGVSTRSQRR